ncbi:MAG: hypothetical protein WA116_06680 [Anaerolineaceae bacterium]
MKQSGQSQGKAILFIWFGQQAVGCMGVMFLSMFVNPILTGSTQAVWQSQVDFSVHGRVFSVHRPIVQITSACFAVDCQR